MIAWPLVRPYYPAFNSDELALLPHCPPPIIGGFSPGEGPLQSARLLCVVHHLPPHPGRRVSGGTERISLSQLLRCIMECKQAHLFKERVMDCGCQGHYPTFFFITAFNVVGKKRLCSVYRH